MHLHQEMLGGWLVGNRSTWVLENLLRHIAKLQQALGYEDVIFCGSSLGGFCAIQPGAMAKQYGISVGKGGVYAENPQVNLFTYKFFTHIDLLAKVGFDAANRESIAPEFAKRFNIVTTLESYGHVPHGLVVIKESDVHHFSDQVPQLASYVKGAPQNTLSIEVIPAAVDPSGHTPLDIEQMKERIQAILANLFQSRGCYSGNYFARPVHSQEAYRCFDDGVHRESSCTKRTLRFSRDICHCRAYRTDLWSNFFNGAPKPSTSGAGI